MVFGPECIGDGTCRFKALNRFAGGLANLYEWEPHSRFSQHCPGSLDRHARLCFLAHGCDPGHYEPHFTALVDCHSRIALGELPDGTDHSSLALVSSRTTV